MLVPINKLFETPDTVYFPSPSAETDFKDHITYFDSQAYPFTVIYDKENKEILGVTLSNIPGIAHYGVERLRENHIKELQRQFPGAKLEEIYPGRLYTKNKILTFWAYPTPEELKVILKFLLAEAKDNELDIDFKDWKIEVYASAPQGEKVYYGNYHGNASKIIPLSEYIGSEDVSDDERQQHLLSPLLKKKRNVAPGWGSKNPRYIANRKWAMASMTDENKKEELYPRLNENPNAIWNEYTKSSKDWTDRVDIAFSYDDDHEMVDMRVGTETHSDLKSYGRRYNSGRLFMKEKIITFWIFPKDYDELVKTLKDVEDACSKQLRRKVNILSDNSWRIEIPIYDENDPSDENNPEDNKAVWGSWNPTKNSQNFIPIHQYKGGPKRSEEELAQQHVLSPLLKSKKKVEVGWGSNSERYKRKRAWQMASMTDESKEENHYPRLEEGVADIAKERMFHVPQEFSEFEKKYSQEQTANVNQKQIDRDVVIPVESMKKGIIKNPTNLEYFPKDARGVIDPEGNLYLLNNHDFIHTHLTKELADAGYLKYQDVWWMKIPQNFVTVQRVWAKDAFIIGESNSVLDPDYNYEGGNLKDEYNMPSIQEARKAYIPFIKAAQKVNPQFKFHPYLLSDLIKKDIAKNKRKKEKKVNEGSSNIDKFYQDRFGIAAPVKPAELYTGYKVVAKVRSWDDRFARVPIIMNPRSLEGFDNKVRAIADANGNLYVAMYNRAFNHGMMANALIDAKIITTEHYDENASKIANVKGIYLDQDKFLLLNRFDNEYVFVASDTFEHYGRITERLIDALKKRNPQFKYRFKMEDFEELDESEKIFETPDIAKYPVEIGGKTSFKDIIWREGETYSFGIYRGKLFISNRGQTHGDIAVKQSKTGQNISVYREKYLYPGRLWKSYKLISFWTYPDAKTFKKIIDELSERLNLNIMNDPEWKVEIIRIKNTGEIRKTKSFTRYNQEGTWLPIWKNEQKNKFEIAHIHPKDYVGSEDVPEEDRAKQHVLSPLLKTKRKVEPGWGSNSERYKRKRAWQMATVGDESKHEPYYPQLFENE